MHRRLGFYTQNKKRMSLFFHNSDVFFFDCIP